MISDMHYCYSCAYAASGKVVGGRECLDPAAEDAVDTAICLGKCYVRSPSQTRPFLPRPKYLHNRLATMSMRENN